MEEKLENYLFVFTNTRKNILEIRNKISYQTKTTSGQYLRGFKKYMFPDFPRRKYTSIHFG